MMNKCKGFHRLFLMLVFILSGLLSAEANAWYAGYGHGYDNHGYYHGWYGPHWGYGAGYGMVVAPGVASTHRCEWVPAYRNAHGYEVPAHTYCW